MGYYTNYRLSTVPASTDKQLEAFLQATEYGPLEVEDGDVNCGDHMKWYNHDQDMKAVSSLHGDTLFILDGDGEEAGDVWRKWFYRGKLAVWRLSNDRPALSSSDAKAIGYVK